jgi:PAS domain S-box-containing protein
MIEQPAAENSRLAPHLSPRRVTARGLDELLDLSPDALVVINQAGTILQANEQAATLFGYRPEEMQGQPLELLLPERLKRLHVAHRQHYFSEPRTRAMGTGLALFGRRQDGREIAVDISLRSTILGDS